MKTVEGAPQFEPEDVEIDIVGRSATRIVFDQANTQLREWAAERQCVQCKYFLSAKQNDPDYSMDTCKRHWFTFDGEDKPETFSCAAFSPPRTKREAK